MVRLQGKAHQRRKSHLLGCDQWVLGLLVIILVPFGLAPLAVASSAHSPDAQTPQFMPEQIPRHVYVNDTNQFVGNGGLAVFDCNNDAFPEVLAAGGAGPATLLRNQSGKDALLFRAETPDSLAVPGMSGVYPLDIDSDGRMDLVILHKQGNQLLRGGEDCEFTPFDDLELAASPPQSTLISATWDAGHHLPVLRFATYVKDNALNEGPETCATTLIYRPDRNSYAPPIAQAPGSCRSGLIQGTRADWPAIFGDVQNDGLVDKVRLKDPTGSSPDGFPASANALLIQQPDGDFHETGGIAGLADPQRGRGASLVDLNRDGALDLAVLDQGGPLQIWQNVTTHRGNWVALALAQPGPNRNAIGGRIEVEQGHGHGHDDTDIDWQSRDIIITGGSPGAQSGFQHFGVGDAGEIGVRVTWPDGTQSDVVHIGPNQFLTLVRTETGLKALR